MQLNENKNMDKYQYIGFLPKTVRIKENNLWRMNRIDGEEIIPLKYLEVFTLSSAFGLIAARENGKWKLFDLSGNLVNQENYDFVYSYYGLFGISKVKIGNKWGLINKFGKRVTPITYAKIEKFAKGLALHYEDTKINFMSQNHLKKLNENKIDIKFSYPKDQQKSYIMNIHPIKIKTS